MIFKESKPIFVQIADRISDEILSGCYVADGRLPSVREYCVLVEVNVNTAMRAFDYLQQQGVIYNKRGIGYFVAPDAVATITALRHKVFLEEYLPEVFRQMKLLGVSFDELRSYWEKQEK